MLPEDFSHPKNEGENFIKTLQTVANAQIRIMSACRLGIANDTAISMT
jgi:hypothetical protein